MKTKRSTLNLIRGWLLLAAVTAAGISLSTLLSVLLHMPGADFQLCMVCVLISGLGALTIFTGFYISNDRRASHSNGTVLYVDCKLSFILTAVILTVAIILSIISPMIGLLGSRSYAAVIEVFFAVAIGCSCYLSFTHFLPDGVIYR